MPKLPRRGHKVKPTSKEIKNKLGEPKKRVSKSNLNLNKARLKGNVQKRIEELPTDTEDDKPTPIEVRGRGDSGKLLTDEHRMRSDILLVEQSVKKGWNVRRKPMLVRRLMDIASKTTGDMNTKDGIVSSETVADNLSIQAIKVLVAMDAQDQTRVKNTEPEVPTTVVNVTNNVLNNNGFDARTIELARLAHNIGARELTISGRSVPIQEILGTADTLPKETGSQSD